MIRLSDYIVRFLADHGIGHVFMVTGGAAMHLNDAFGRESRIKKVYCHHEQSCAMAAESYFRVSSRIAAVNVTAGPGATNAITEIYGVARSCGGAVASVTSSTLCFNTSPYRYVSSVERAWGELGLRCQISLEKGIRKTAACCHDLQ